MKVGLFTTFSVKIPLFQGIFTPDNPSFYGIFWGHMFCQYGGWGWSELFSEFTPNFTTPLAEKNGEKIHSTLLQGGCSLRLQEKVVSTAQAAIFTLRFVNQGPVNGGVSNGGASRSGLVLRFLSFFVLFRTFPIFLGFSRFARGWSGDFPDLSFYSFSAY